jgi:phosphatidylserine decarboxylase
VTVLNSVLRWLLEPPFALATRIAGRLFRSRASRWLVRPYARWYSVNVAEAEQDLSHYASLTAFFARRLRAGSRALPAEADGLVCPVDGLVIAAGRISADTVLRIKRSELSVDTLLSPIPPARYAQGSYAVIYLGPGDYHRIHAPVSGVCERIVQIAGAYLPVHALGRAFVPDVFVRNQRVAVEFCCGQDGTGGSYVALVCVGSAIVGSVRLSELSKEGASLMMGEEVGWFEFGSTVVVLTTSAGPAIDLPVGARVRALSPMSLAVEAQKNPPRPG